MCVSFPSEKRQVYWPVFASSTSGKKTFSFEGNLGWEAWLEWKVCYVIASEMVWRKFSEAIQHVLKFNSLQSWLTADLRLKIIKNPK